MPWPFLAVAWVVWMHPLEGPCEAAGTPTALQRLGGPPAGAATVDVSADGRFVAFVSLARLADADDNVVDDIYVLDRTTGAVSLETAAGARASDGSSVSPRLNGDGRHLVFSSVARNLFEGRSEVISSQVFWRDRTTGSTILVSHTPANRPGDGWSGRPDISDDGRYVAFESRATDLVAGGDANGNGSDIYLYDTADRSLRRISLTSTGAQPVSGESASPVISGTGRVVAFASTAPLDAPARPSPPAGRNVLPPRSIFLRDVPAGVTRRITPAGQKRGADSGSYQPAISGDGLHVAFVSTAATRDDHRRLTRQDQVYVYDVDTARLRIVSRGPTGEAADGASRHPALSGDGRYVVFSSNASNLPCAGTCGGARADLNMVADVYRVDTTTGVAERVSGGASAREPWWNASAGAAIDATGRVVAFSSRQPLDDADLDHDDDLFVEVLGGPAGIAADARRAAPCAPSDRRPGGSFP